MYTFYSPLTYSAYYFILWLAGYLCLQLKSRRRKWIKIQLSCTTATTASLTTLLCALFMKMQLKCEWHLSPTSCGNNTRLRHLPGISPQSRLILLLTYCFISGRHSLLGWPQFKLSAHFNNYQRELKKLFLN